MRTSGSPAKPAVSARGRGQFRLAVALALLGVFATGVAISTILLPLPGGGGCGSILRPEFGPTIADVRCREYVRVRAVGSVVFGGSAIVLDVAAIAILVRRETLARRGAFDVPAGTPRPSGRKR